MNRTPRIHARTRVAALALSVATVVPLVASSASARVTCAASRSTLVVTLPDDRSHHVLERVGRYLHLNGSACSRLALDQLRSVTVRHVSTAPTHLLIRVPGAGFTGRAGADLSWDVSLAGSADALTLEGTPEANRIRVGAGAADLGGSRAYELAFAGAESVSLQGGGGADRLRYGGGATRADFATTTATASTIGSYPSARIFGGAGNDRITGDDRVNVIWAQDGDDTVYAKGGDDEVQGGAGNDTLFGGDGDDLVNGGDGDDGEYGGGNTDLFQQGPQEVHASATPVAIPDVGKALSSVTVPETSLPAVDVNVRVYIDHPSTQDIWVTLITPWNNRVRLAERRGNGTSFDGTQFDSEAFTNIRHAGTKDLSGRFHPEWSMELAQANPPTGEWMLWVEDKVGGSTGTIQGWELELGMPAGVGNGADVVSGGTANNDLVVYSQRTAGVNATLVGGADDGQAFEGDNLGTATTCPVSLPTGSQCSDLEWVYTGSGDDVLTGNDLANDLRGAAGHDSLTALGSGDQLRGANGQDTFSAGAGNDVIHGQGNPDGIDGGEGFDRVIYGYSPVGMTVDISDPALGTASDGEAGNDDDTLTFIEHITGTNKADSIVGNSFVNIFYAGPGDDYLDGREGNDTLDGNAGIDTCLNGETNTGCETTTSPTEPAP
ncbi:MAG: proprotein convertase P-domain-containing protein [Actinomycetota bacterium]|nr:proprotein convertase P-domain-containing protein [Actinomycetota bacterium]